MSPARPFLKWAGGKTQLLAEILPRIDEARFAGRYFEPFVGGGAVFFAMMASGRISQATLSDANPNLIETYRAVRDDVEGLLSALSAHRELHCEDYYYSIRETFPGAPTARAARIIYLNKTCFNGLYRENSRGAFNVPFGRYANPNICDETTLRQASQALHASEIEARPFEAIVASAGRGDFVYFDPPYVPVSTTASFTAYAKGGFGESDQVRLAKVFSKLDRQGAKVLLSNSMTPRVRELYGNYRIDVVQAARSVNRNADGRGKVDEALVRNF